MLRTTVEKVSAPSDKDISWLNRTTLAAAVYASWPSLPSAHATLASRWLATPYLGWTFTSGSRQPPGAFLYPSYIKRILCRCVGWIARSRNPSRPVRRTLRHMGAMHGRQTIPHHPHRG